MDAAKKSLANLRASIAAHRNAADGTQPDLTGYLQEFADAVNDDLNIPRALGILWNMVRGESKSKAVYDAALKMDLVLGLDLDRMTDEQPSDDFTPEEIAEIEAMIAARTAAKKAKNYAEADRIRAELASRGIVLTDTKDGTTYARA
jgi:cysteinyl-tRNA synthetase